VRRDALPHIDEAGARALVEDLVALLVREHGFSRPAPQRPSILRPSVGVMARSSATGATGPRATMSRLMGLLRAVAQATPNLDRNQKLFWAACRVREMSAAGSWTARRRPVPARRCTKQRSTPDCHQPKSLAQSQAQ
jgi:hypothetical protein